MSKKSYEITRNADNTLTLTVGGASKTFRNTISLASFAKQLYTVAKREALEWRRDPTMPSYEEWRNQMLSGLRPSDWDKFIVR